MRSIKHILLLLLALAMLTVVLVGCDGTSDSATATEAETSTIDPATETATENVTTAGTEAETTTGTETTTETEAETTTGTETTTETEAETVTGTETTTEAETETEIPLYALTFTSNGDGTCYVSHVEFLENIDDREITLVFPEKSPEGDTVTAIRYATGDNLPRIISDTDFRKNIIAPLLEYCGVRPHLEELGLIQPGQDLAELDFETVPDDIFYTDNMAFPFRFRMLISWYGGQNGKKSLASVADEEARQKLIETYPALIEHPDVAFWTLDEHISSAQAEKQGTFLLNASYYPADAARDEANMWLNERGTTVHYCHNIVAMEFPDTLKDFDFSTINCYLDIRSIQLPDCVTNIADVAFAGCAELASVKMPDSVTGIGDSAFNGCTGLTSITIPDSVTSIGNSAFYGCTGLTSITIPDSVTSIGNSAFNGCTGLTEITLPAGVTGIGNSAFYDCTGLTSITIPDSVTSIGNSAFYGCTGLTSITIPDSVTSIGNSAFYGCTGLTSITIPDSVTGIGSHAFSGTAWYEAYCGDASNWVSDMLYINSCLLDFKGGKVDTISIREGTTCIAGSVFANCTGLTSIVIPDGVLTIGDSAFSDCTALKNITLPDSVTDIGALAFSGCTQLRNVTFQGTTAQWRAISKGDDWNRNVPSYCKWHFSADGDISK